jgi:hypothetical protein
MLIAKRISFSLVELAEEARFYSNRVDGVETFCVASLPVDFALAYANADR